MSQAKRMLNNEFIQGSLVSAKRGQEFTQRLKRIQNRSRDAKEAVQGMVTGGRWVPSRVPASLASGMLGKKNMTFY